MSTTNNTVKHYIVSIFLVFFLCIFFNNISCTRATKYPVSVRKLQKQLKESNNNVHVYEELIELLYKHQYYQEALKYCSELLQFDIDSLFSLMYAGGCCEALGNWDEAEEYYSKACEDFSKNSEGYCGLGLLYYRKGFYKDSIKHLRKALSIGVVDKKKYINMLLAIAEAYFYNKDSRKAYGTIDEVFKLDPLNQDALYVQGIWKLREGKYTESIQSLNLLISQTPQNSLPYLALGKAYYNSKQLDLAEQMFLNASQYDASLEVLAKIVNTEKLYSLYKGVNTAFVKVIELHQYKEGERFYVRGIIENMGLEVAKWVSVVVKFVDKKDKVINQQVYILSPKNLRPEQYAFFKLNIPYSNDIYDVEVEPNWHKRSTSVYLK